MNSVYIFLRQNQKIMKMIILYMIILVSLYSNSFSQTTVWDSLQHQSQWRNFKVHTPPSYSSSSTYPLVIALHGGNHDANIMEYITNLTQKSDEANFIVVYPNGLSILGLRTWNAGTCCGPAVSYNVDDVGFIIKMIKKLRESYNIDTNRIYVTGASNGGMLAYRLACEKADVFAAIAPVATTMVTNTPCSPARAVPLLHIHSLPDRRVPYNGGFGTGFAGVYMPPIDSVLNVWGNNANCTGTIDTIYNISGVIGKKWTNCNICSDVLLYITMDGGHSWPGGNQTANGDPPSTQLNATNLIWNFFAPHRLNCTTSQVKFLDKNEDDKTLISIYPNPTNSDVRIEMKEFPIHFKVSLYNSIGQKIISLKNQKELNLNNLSQGVIF